MPAMASPLRAAAAVLKRNAPALCFEVDLSRQAFVAGAAVAGGQGIGLLAPFSDPDISFDIFPSCLAKLVPEGLQAIPKSEVLYQGVPSLSPSQGIGLLAPFSDPDIYFDIFPSCLAKLVPEGLQAIPKSEVLYQGVPSLSPSQNSHRFLLGGVALTGMILLAEASEGNSEKAEDVLAGQTAAVVELLKQQLEKSSHLEAENQKLKQEANCRDRQLSHDLQIEITRQAHEEAMAQYRLDESRLELERLRLKTDQNQGGDDKGSGGDKKPGDHQNKEKSEGDKNESKNDDKESLYKKFFRYFMAPSTVETLFKAVEDNWVRWGQVGGVGSLFLGCSRSEWRKIFKGELKYLDPRNEVVEMRTCPCGLPWPEHCFKCGRELPDYVSPGVPPVVRDGTPTVSIAGSSVNKKGPAN